MAAKPIAHGAAVADADWAIVDLTAHSCAMA
jgi:hypothetical protein